MPPKKRAPRKKKEEANILEFDDDASVASVASVTAVASSSPVPSQEPPQSSSMFAAIRREIREEIHDSVVASVRAEVRDSVVQSLREELEGELREELREEVEATIRSEHSEGGKGAELDSTSVANNHTMNFTDYQAMRRGTVGYDDVMGGNIIQFS